ncbi:hypothetical protein GSI_04219 [Ganoderma sinense ZZ0214-1]|uniref:Uncharacterized protein n=1 Tax=Ganoderma sinense ZZ0214-1 TaxID=1077348 RepID=A0A2G8SIK6_9APHY|nr:hypothetical protein GSI_04219 [Ganoderma sinense ZZ0214-1]
MTNPQKQGRPLSAGEFSHNVTSSLAGPPPRYSSALAPTSPPPPMASLFSRAFKRKRRDTELDRARERLARELRAMESLLAHWHDRETSSEASKTGTSGLSRAGALQVTQAEIDPLTVLSSGMVDAGSGEEALPRYEDLEPRHGQDAN